jgi:hypothetical protein
MVGMLHEIPGVTVISNREKGLGRSDVILTIASKTILIEMKAKKNLTLQKQIEYGFKQIKDNRYIEGAIAEGYQNVVAYAFAFAKKTCTVRKF